MAKSLRNKLANMALCCTVVTSTVGQVIPVFAQDEVVIKNEAAVGDRNIHSMAITTGSALKITTEESVQDPWEDEKVDAKHYGTIKVYKVNQDQESMAAQFFTKEDLPIEIVDGKVSLKLKVSKDGMGVQDAITSLEQKVGEKTYEALTLKYANAADVRYIVTEINFENIEEPVVLKCGIDAGFTKMTQELRVFLTEETIAYLKAQGIGQEKTSVAMNVTHTDETVYEAADGSITITATGGKGNYEYTIDGGQNWSTEYVFENLEPGTYNVAVRDADDRTNVTEFKEIVIIKKEKLSSQMPEGKYDVEIEVLHETKDEPSKLAGYVTKENVSLNIQDSKAYLTFKVARDDLKFGDNGLDMIGNLGLKVGDTYEALDLNYVEDETGRYVVTEIVLDSLDEVAYLQCDMVRPFAHSAKVRVKLTTDSIHKILDSQTPETKPEIAPVEISVEKTDATGLTGTITVTATGGEGTYEYTIDGGANWQSANHFTGLAVGTYQVGARDVQNTENVSAFQEIVIAEKGASNNGDLEDGYYSVNIEVLHETQNTASMAAGFFNTEGLPLHIQNGVAYLTIQVLKDGMGMKDVITSLEQRIDGKYRSLYLNYLNDSSKRYVTAEVKLESVDDTAYLRCGIAPMQGMNPVLRIKLDQSSIQEGAGSINTNFKPDEAMTINKVEAENGKVTVYLNGTDEELTANDFQGKVYLNGDTKGESLRLKDFKMEDEVISFTYDAIEAAEKDKTVTIGITLNEVETKSNTFTVKGSLSESSTTTLSLKENAKEIKYIKGYEDGTFRPKNKVTKAEALSMLSLLVNGVQNSYYSADISILHATKDEASMAGQFFKNDGIRIKKQGEGYFIELEIANEGLGFTNIITGIEQKIGDHYKALEVRKSQDMKKAYVTLEVASLEEAITLKTGIAPMGNVAPELRIVVDTKSLTETEFVSSYIDIDMWAKDAITLFEEAGIIGEDGKETFSPNEYITRAEFVKIIVLVGGLQVSEDYTHTFKDIKGHALEAYIAAAAEADYVHGCGDNTFKPEGILTRAEAVKVINKLVGNTEEPNVDIENPFKDLSPNYWAYTEILKVTEG